jgi:hypothetical protein
MGILNVLGHFAAPALAPVLLNLAMISAVLFISPHLNKPVLGLAIGVVCGGVMQLGLQVPFLIRHGIKFWQKTTLFHPGLKKIGKMLAPVIIGGAAYQLNILVSTLLASFLKEGSVSYLYFADRLVQFPLGIFAVATATAVLPGLSRQAAVNDVKALKATFAYAMKLILFITLPAMVGLIVLREPIVALLFQRGEFGSDAAVLTAYALLYYAIGLWAFSAVRTDTCADRYYFYNCQYFIRNHVDATARPWRPCAGNHAGFHRKPRTSDQGAADKARSTGMEKYSFIGLSNHGVLRDHGNSGLDGRRGVNSIRRTIDFNFITWINGEHCQRPADIRRCLLSHQKPGIHRHRGRSKK